MNLYKITPMIEPDATRHFDGAIVVANSADEARFIYPNGDIHTYINAIHVSIFSVWWICYNHSHSKAFSDFYFTFFAKNRKRIN